MQLKLLRLFLAQAPQTGTVPPPLVNHCDAHTALNHAGGCIVNLVLGPLLGCLHILSQSKQGMS